ncbi:MAG: hypothetical protein K1X56_06105 [Flavobacteriales bacterium]|nr:hypothetical protein [Flavobacteriales bacterium]
MKQVLFFILIVFAQQANAQYGNSFSFSSDGSIMLYDDGSKWKLYHLPDASLLRSYSAEELLQQIDEEFDPSQPYYVDGKLNPELSGDGKTVVFYCNLHYYYFGTQEVKPLVRKFSESESAKQSMFSFRVNYNGTKLITTYVGTDAVDGVGGCSPGYRIPQYFEFRKAATFLHEKNGCYFVTATDMDESGNVVIHAPDFILYGNPNEKLKPLFNSNQFRLTAKPFFNEGRSLFLNGRIPINDSLKVVRQARMDRALLQQLSIPITEKEFAKISEEVREKEWPEYKSKMDWIRFCHPDSIWTLMETHLVNGKWTSPKPAMPVQLDPVAWASSISPNGKKVMWVDLVRGDDGNSIVVRNLCLTQRLSNGTWTKAKVIAKMEDHNSMLSVFNDFAVYQDAGRCYVVNFNKSFTKKEVYL